MEYEEDFDQFYARKKPPYSPDLHLKTAIKSYEREMFIQGYGGEDKPIHFPVKKSIDAYKKYQKKPTGILDMMSEHSYRTLLNPCLSHNGKGYKYTRSLEDNLKIAKDLVLESVKILFVTLKSMKQTQDRIQKKISEIKLDNSLREWIVYRNVWEAIRDIMKDLQISEDYSFREVAKDLLIVQIWVNPYYAIIKEGDERCWLLDYNQILMISDTIGSRFLSLLYCKIQETLDIIPSPSRDNLMKLYEAGDSLFPIYGNSAYNHIKQLESLCVAVYLENYESLSISKNYINQLREEIADDPEMTESLNLFYITIKEISSHPLIIFEIFGCFRHFGHPTVDELEGVQSLRENSQADIAMDNCQLQKVLGAFNRMIIIEFIAQRRRWPKCKLNEDCKSPSMKKLVQTKPVAISEYDLVLELKEWSYIEFDQEFQFDDFPDFTALLSDTAISPYLENWYSIFSRDLLNVYIPENIEESRRVLIEVLRRENIDCRKIREIIQSGKIPESWLVVGLHSKERELKIKARLFAMLCLEMRLYFNMTEKNISEKIFPLIPYQTMTWSDAELNKVMLNLSSLHSGKDKHLGGKYVYVIISLDFNKFNQKWRYESTAGVFRNIDRLFGTPNLLEYSHLFFQQAFFYLSSNLRPPWTLTRKTGDKNYPITHIPYLKFNSDTTWVGQGGGCEGLRQKGWTAIIVSALVANSFDTGVEGQIIGQGDNQVIVASFKVPDDSISPGEYIKNHGEELTKRINTYLDNLKKITGGIGMDLKLQESWVSTKLLNYGKEIIVDGSYTSGGIKKISRAYQDVSEIFPSFPNRVSSMFTAAQSTAMKSFDTLAPYLIAIFDCLNMISKEGKYGTTMEGRLKRLMIEERVQLDDHLKWVFLLLPRECGGLPVIPYLNLTFRGHPDQMTSTLAWLKALALENPVARRILDLIVSGYFNNPTTDYLQLIQDPYSINYRKTVQSSNKIKHALLSVMRERTNNKAVTQMMEACNEETLSTFAQYLSETDPLCPRVLNEILRLSPEGSMQGFLSIFKDMRTMKQMLDPYSANSLVEKLRSSDLELLQHIIQISKKIKSDECHRMIRDILKIDPKMWIAEKIKCTTLLAQEIREVSWGKRVEGVSIPHPVEQAAIYLSDGDRCDYPACNGSEMIIYVVLDERKRPGEPLIFDGGPLKPYLGSGTSEKRSGPVLNYPRTEKALRASQQLLRVLNWTVDRENKDNTLVQFLKDLIASRCDASENFLILTSGVNYGGSVQHRFSDVTSKHESRPGIRVNTHSRVMISSDQLGKYARGKDNYPLVFQSLYLYALHLINTVLIYQPDVLSAGNLVFHQHLICEGCLPLLSELPMLNTSRPPNIPTLKDCPLIYTRIDASLSEIPQTCIENCATIEPNPEDPDIRKKSAYAASLLVVGETSHAVTPLLHSNLKRQHREGTLVCLTVGFFMKIGLKNLFQQLSVVWMLDNLPQILKISLEYGAGLFEASEMLMDRFPDNAWDLLKPFLCLKEIQREARQKLGMTSTSSEIFLTGKGLGYAIGQSILRELEPMLGDSSSQIAKKFFRLPFVTTTPGISLDRCVFIWVNSCMMLGPWGNIKQLSVLVDLGKECLSKCWKGEGLDTSGLMVLLSNIVLGGESLSHSITNNRLVISRVGVEPWVVPKILPEKKQHRVNIVHINPTNIDIDIRRAILWIMKSIGCSTNLILAPTRSDTSNEELPTSIIYPERRTHTRSDHFYRLVGTYSTAGLKYSQIFSEKNLGEVSGSGHLAEGAGGVARVGTLLLGSKKIIYNSLVQVGPGLNHRAYEYIPAELQDLENVEIRGPTFCYQTGGDITKKATISRYKDLVTEWNKDIQVLTCDAEFPEEGSIKQARSLLISFLEIAAGSRENTVLIFKTFCRIREVLLHQISIWTELIEDPEIIIPKFSSHESSEIFLVGKRGSRKFNESSLRVINRSNIVLVDSLIEVRNKPFPLVSRVSLEILEDLYHFYDYIGVKFNYFEAVIIFLNYTITEMDLRSSILKAISICIDFNRMRIDERAELISRFQRAVDLTHLQKLMTQSIRKDSRELHLGAETIFNANILRAIIWNKSIPESFFVSDWIIERNGQVLYTYTPCWEEWVGVYGRCFFKILGYHTILLHQKLDLPLFMANLLQEDLRG